MFCTSVREVLGDQRPHVAITLQLLYSETKCYTALNCNIAIAASCRRAISVQSYNMYIIAQRVRANIEPRALRMLVNLMFFSNPNVQ